MCSRAGHLARQRPAAPDRADRPARRAGWGAPGDRRGVSPRRRDDARGGAARADGVVGRVFATTGLLMLAIGLTARLLPRRL